MKKLVGIFIWICCFLNAEAQSWRNPIISSIDHEKKIAKKIQSKKVKLRSSEITEIVHFIENYFLSYVNNGEFYARRQKTGLACDIEYDPETELVFIHEINSPILHRQKILYKSIQYDEEDPKIVFVTSNIEPSTDLEEVKILRKLPVSERVPNIIASPTHEENGRLSQKIILPCYEGGDLKVTEKNQFSIKEKVVLAMDLMEALKEVHKIGIFHGDVHGGNILLTKKGNFKGVGFRAVLIDWASSKIIDEEPFAFRKLQIRDLYFAGCSLYCIFYLGKYNNDMFRKLKLGHKNLPDYGSVIEEITPAISERKKFLYKKKKKTVEEKLEWYVLRMIHPTFEMKEDAAFWYEEYRKLLAQNF